jgi:putative transposase
MKRTRHTPEQIVRMLREAEAKLAAGSSAPQVVAKEFGISEATFYRWKARYSGMSSQEEAKRLKELEKENAHLKKLLAEKKLDIDMLKEVSQGKTSTAACTDIGPHDLVSLAYRSRRRPLSPRASF